MKAQEITVAMPAFTVVERAVHYARVSGDDRKNEGRNLEDGQLNLCRDHSAHYHYNVVAEFAEDDRGASGYEIDLPKLSKIREMARNREFDVLVVRELDRLSRNLAKQLIVEEELKRYGVRIEYVLAEYDDSPEGRLQKHIRATIAEYEREKIKERLVRGRRQSVKAGNIIVSDRPPYGYKVVKNEGKITLEIVEEEIQIVQLIFEWYLIGDESSKPLSLSGIAKKLTQMGIPTRGDTYKHVRKKRGYAQWNKRTVCRILKRETYTGIWYYGKSSSSEPIPVPVPAIISQEVWEAAQEKLEENQEKSRRNMKYNYLLSGHITCGICGYRMSGICKKHKEKRYFYYRCPANEYVDSTRKCVLPHFTANEVESAVWSWIKSILISPEQLGSGLKQYQDQQAQTVAPLQERLKIVDDLLAENQTQLQRLLDLYLKGDFPKEMLTERKDRLETTIKNLKDERARLSAHLEAKMLTEEQIRTVKDFAEKVQEGLTAAENDFESQRQIIEMLDIQVTLTIESGKKVAYVQCRLGEKLLSIKTLASYEKFWYNGLKLNSPFYLRCCPLYLP